jgi:hypothetical protein
VHYPRGGTQDGHHMAAALLADFATLLAAPGLTKVNWAQFLDSGHGNYSGMVTIDGERKPVLSAYEFYQNMPTDRCVLEIDGPPGVGGLAGVEPGRLCVAVWNRSPRAVRVRLDLGEHAYESVALRRIDDGHDGAEAERLPAERYWDLELPRGGVALLEATDTAAQTAPAAPAGAVRRVRHRYTARTTSAWADLEEATTTFRLGTATDPHAVPVITADLEDCGETITVTGRLTDAGGAPLTGGRLVVRIDGDAGQSRELYLDEQALQTVDLTGLGAEPGRVSVTVALRDAPEHAFATVTLT